MPERVTVDTLITARWVVPVEPEGVVLDRHGIAIRDGRIEAVAPIEELEARFEARDRIALGGHALIPGLVNLHTHAAMTLLRGLADDLPLMDWLKHHIWPVEMKYADRQFVLDGTLLACAEMLKGGVTCFNDMYFFPESAAEAVLACGMRAALGIIVIDFPTAYAADPDDYLHKGLALRDRYRGHSHLFFCAAPHAPYTVSDKAFGKLVTFAEQLDLPIHIHLHETDDEIRGSLAQHGVRPIQRLQGLGLLGPSLVAVHMVHLNPSEIELVAQQGCHVAHCPSSNLKLASGIAPVHQLLDRGVNVGLGTDGAASNNRLDLFEEMRLAALLAKAASGKADTLPAHAALRMATLNGARALGKDGLFGSLVPGKAADIVAVDFSAIELAPCYDPVSHLVYAAGREDVTDVWVAGRRLVRQGELATLDENELRTRAAEWREKIRIADRGSGSAG
ncbi:MAG: TRZ/ATZ family hydrolase [Betaproteobacteria bacterium]|nr:TRZ/ATZ family hydrolase [Betaproteobacteria bacterium]